MPWMLLAGLGLGAVQALTGGATASAQSKEKAEDERMSPWSKLPIQQMQPYNPVGNLMQGGLMGALMQNQMGWGGNTPTATTTGGTAGIDAATATDAEANVGSPDDFSSNGVTGFGPTAPGSDTGFGAMGPAQANLSPIQRAMSNAFLMNGQPNMYAQQAYNPWQGMMPQYGAQNG